MQLILETDAIDNKANMSDVGIIENKPVPNGLGEHNKNGSISSTNGITKAAQITEDVENVTNRNAGSGAKKQEDEIVERVKVDEIQLENNEKLDVQNDFFSEDCGHDVADFTEKALLALDCDLTRNVVKTVTKDECRTSQGECAVTDSNFKIKENGEENSTKESVTQEEKQKKQEINEIKLKTEANILLPDAESNQTINAQKNDSNSTMVETTEEDINKVSSIEKEILKFPKLDENFTENESLGNDKKMYDKDLASLTDKTDESFQKTENTDITCPINNKSKDICKSITVDKINELQDSENEKAVFNDVDSTMPHVTTESDINDVESTLPHVISESDISDVDSPLPPMTTASEINNLKLTSPLETSQSDINEMDSTLLYNITESHNSKKTEEIFEKDTIHEDEIMEVDDLENVKHAISPKGEETVDSMDCDTEIKETENLLLKDGNAQNDSEEVGKIKSASKETEDLMDCSTEFQETKNLLVKDGHAQNDSEELEKIKSTANDNEKVKDINAQNDTEEVQKIKSTAYDSEKVKDGNSQNDSEEVERIKSTANDHEKQDIRTMTIISSDGSDDVQVKELSGQSTKSMESTKSQLDVEMIEVEKEVFNEETNMISEKTDVVTESKAIVIEKSGVANEDVKELVTDKPKEVNDEHRNELVATEPKEIINQDVKELFKEEPKEVVKEDSSELISEKPREDIIREEVTELVTEEPIKAIKEISSDLVAEEPREEKIISEDVTELFTEEQTEIIKADLTGLLSEKHKEKEIINEDIKERVSEKPREVVNDEVKELDTDEPNKEITEEVKCIVSNDQEAITKEVITEELKEGVTEKSQSVNELKNDGIEENNSKTNKANETPIDNQNSDKKAKRSFSGLSNTLNILSDDEDDILEEAVMRTDNETENKCINIEDDDDVMLIDEEITTKDGKTVPTKSEEVKQNVPEKKEESEVKVSKPIEENQDISKIESDLLDNKEITKSTETAPEIEIPSIKEKTQEHPDIISKVKERKPLVPPNFLKTFKKNVAEMTRDELEEFCLLKIVEGVVDRSNLSEIKGKLKTISQNMEEWRKKAMMLTKQNRDLQIVLKTVQEEQKKKPDVHIAPLKITRSVGMQVYMAEHNERGVKRKVSNQTPPQNTRNRPTVNPSPSTPALNLRPAKPNNNNNAQIPVPRLVLASNSSPAKNTKPTNSIVQNSTVSSNSEKVSQVANAVKPPPPVKSAEKRSFSTVQSVTVDLTDDEPPAKQMATSRNATQASPVRVVNQNQLMGPRAQSFNQQNNNIGPTKVYIPINHNQGIRPGQTIRLKSVPPQTPRPRGNGPMIRLPGPMRIPRPSPTLRHPAPLPTVAKQSQPPNWKALPPAPDLKISKVENGIVISWKIEGYQEDSYETIASYQLYAYQETSSPSTLLWKKIGDVKALPLPMACTLTQFVAGYKYYFAVRAVDIRSRIGPFSLPGSILLLNK